MQFPLKKSLITINNTEKGFHSHYVDRTEIPVAPHPGAFGVVRKNHIHEGIDLYCEDGDCVYAMEDGVILYIAPFTGVACNSPWWNDTWCCMVAATSTVINYGEIIVDARWKVGDAVQQGDIIGTVRTVLKKDKGRPMSMLHLECYSHEATAPVSSWDLDTEQDATLLDPTPLLLPFLTPQ